MAEVGHALVSFVRFREVSFKNKLTVASILSSCRLRRLLLAVCEHKYFDYVVLFFILISCVALALEEPNIGHQVLTHFPSVTRLSRPKVISKAR